MEINKELKIVPPEGMEYYIENDTVKFRPIKKKFTYDDIAKELFFNKNTYYPQDSINGSLDIEKVRMGNIAFTNFPFNCTSEKQIDKLAAYNKLMNVAKYLNGDWKLDWNNDYKYYPTICEDEIEIASIVCIKNSSIYFKSEELAKQALEILGEETIRIALSTDW